MWEKFIFSLSAVGEIPLTDDGEIPVIRRPLSGHADEAFFEVTGITGSGIGIQHPFEDSEDFVTHKGDDGQEEDVLDGRLPSCLFFS